MCVNGQGAELWETVFAVCGKDDSFSIGGAAVFHISIV